MNGVKVDFPIIYEDDIDEKTGEPKVINDEDELINYVDKTLNELRNTDDKVKPIHAFTQLSIGSDFAVNTIQFIDKRTQEILDMYDYNETCPNFYSRSELDNYVIYSSFRMIKKFKPRMF